MEFKYCTLVVHYMCFVCDKMTQWWTTFLCITHAQKVPPKAVWVDILGRLGVH